MKTCHQTILDIAASVRETSPALAEELISLMQVDQLDTESQEILDNSRFPRKAFAPYAEVSAKHPSSPEHCRRMAGSHFEVAGAYKRLEIALWDMQRIAEEGYSAFQHGGLSSPL